MSVLSRHQSSCKVIWSCKFLTDVLTGKICAFSLISLICIIICLIILSFLIVIQDFCSCFRYFLQTFCIHYRAKSTLSKRNATVAEKKDRDEMLSKGEVKMVMEKLGIICSPADSEVGEIVGVDQFAALFEEKEPSLEEVKEAFDLFDENRDGFIDVMELKRISSALGVTTSEEDCTRMIKVFDDDGDARIDFKEFVRLLEKSFG